MATEITTADIEQLADRLEQVDLTDHERTVLTGVFTMAGLAAYAQAAEVEGFAAVDYKGQTKAGPIFMNPGQTQGEPIYMKPGQLVPAVQGGGGLIGGFSWGMSGGGGGAG